MQSCICDGLPFRVRQSQVCFTAVVRHPSSLSTCDTDELRYFW